LGNGGGGVLEMGEAVTHGELGGNLWGTYGVGCGVVQGRRESRRSV